MRDKLTIQAIKQGFRARSYFKIKEIDQKFKIFQKNDLVLDLGCWPGGWIIYALSKIGPSGFVTGIDLRAIDPLPESNYKFIKGDITNPNLIKKLRYFNIIISDLSPKTTGIRDLDQLKSFQLSQQALNIAKKHLKNNGQLLVKTFQSEDTIHLLKELKKYFNKIRTIKPSSSKKRSKEVYVLASEFRDKINTKP